MTTETILSSATEFEAMCNGNGIPLTVYEDGRGYSNERTKAAFIAWQAVLQSQEIQALRKDARRMRRNTLLAVLGELNSNPYNLTKSECIDVVREMFEEAGAAMEQQK